MVRMGFLLGIRVYPNPHLLGLRSGSYAIEVGADRTKSQVIEELSRLPGVVFFEDFHSPLLGIGLAYRDEGSLQRTLRAIDHTAHADRGSFTSVDHPSISISLSGPEWALLARLMQGRDPLDRLAGELHVAPRTVKRRIARLVRNNAILTSPRLAYRALAGGATAELLVGYRDTGAKPSVVARIERLVDAWLTFAGVWDEFAIFRLLLPNVALANEIGRDVRRLEGVRSTRVEFVDGLIDRFEGFLPLVEERARAGTASSAQERAYKPPPGERHRSYTRALEAEPDSARRNRGGRADISQGARSHGDPGSF
jgi:DNA-binding Lrp family transcriptional regulator